MCLNHLPIILLIAFGLDFHPIQPKYTGIAPSSNKAMIPILPGCWYIPINITAAFTTICSTMVAFQTCTKNQTFIYFTTITKQVIHTIYINHARWHRCLHLCGLPNLYTQSYKHIYVGLIQASSLHISQLCVDLKNKMSICHKICLYRHVKLAYNKKANVYCQSE